MSRNNIHPFLSLHDILCSLDIHITFNGLHLSYHLNIIVTVIIALKDGSELLPT
jgi:hypothetical protein